ncbi:putative peptidoglycan lipid II flippase [Alkalibacillus flavidus]|uniref:Peptidoglycan lipid II flippase n=1 Tax=Alkalibacillus flavidus TaxID=546021 RepID=A0ABV2KXB1_9BACI
MSTLKKAAIWTTLLSIVLKLIGFVRESLIAREFGANEYTDGFLLSFTFVTLILAIIANGFNSAFLPHYVSARKERPESADRDASGVMNLVSLFFAGLSVIMYFFAPQIVPLIFGNMHSTTEEIAVEITRFFFMFMVIIALSGMLESYLQSRRIFVPTQINKLMGTLMAVVFILLFSDVWGIHAVAYGFIFGTFCGVLIQFYYLLKAKFNWQPTLSMDPEFKKTFFILLAPALLHSSVGHINVFINRLFATDTVSGGVTYLNNAALLMSIPSTIFITTVLAIVFTLMSERADDAYQFKETVFNGYQIGMMALVPIAVGTLLLGEELIAFIYERGAFTAEDTANTFDALKWYTPAILTQGLVMIAVKGMYAKGWTKRILMISSVTIILNIALNSVLVERFSYPALAMSTSIVSTYYATAATIALYKGYPKAELWRLLGLFARVLVPALIMAVPIVTIQFLTPVDSLYSLWQILILVPIGVATYIAALYVVYREGFNELVKVAKMK